MFYRSLGNQRHYWIFRQQAGICALLSAASILIAQITPEAQARVIPTFAVAMAAERQICFVFIFSQGKELFPLFPFWILVIIIIIIIIIISTMCLLPACDDQVRAKVYKPDWLSRIKGPTDH